MSNTAILDTLQSEKYINSHSIHYVTWIPPLGCKSLPWHILRRNMGYMTLLRISPRYGRYVYDCYHLLILAASISLGSA
jgi:hypothetical protein